MIHFCLQYLIYGQDKDIKMAPKYKNVESIIYIRTYIYVIKISRTNNRAIFGPTDFASFYCSYKTSLIYQLNNALTENCILIKSCVFDHMLIKTL